MKFSVNFQYRPEDRERPQDEPMLDVTGKALDIVFENGGLIPNIGDHVIFCRAGGERDGNGNYVSKIEQKQGVVENRLFVFFNADHVVVNIVVTDSQTNSGLLIKE